MENLKASTSKPWYSGGKYQTEFNKMTKELMPDSGDSDTYIGQIITSLNRLLYDYFNNGNCNVTDYKMTQEEEWSDEEVDEDGEVIKESEKICEEEGDLVITGFYQKLFDTLTGISPEIANLVSKIEQFCCEDWYRIKGQFEDRHIEMYNLLVDLCMEAILTSKVEDKPMAERY